MEIINKSVCRGVAGKRQGKVKGIVIHNDAGSINATAKHYVSALEKMNNSQLANGFAHYYIDRNTVARVEDTFNQAWHTANVDGNANYIGYEVCQSIGASDVDFLANEQATFKQVAEDLKFYGLKANRNTVKLHREFVATACPHRSWDLHGKSVNSVKDYFISQINKYMDGGATVAKAKVLDAKKFPAMVKMVRGNKVYNGPNFGPKSLSRAFFPKDTVIYASGIVYSASGKPRIKTNSGYTLATDNYVKFL